MQAVLTVNAGNGAVSFAVYEEGVAVVEATPLNVFRISTLATRTADEYAVLLQAMLMRIQNDVTVTCVVLSSVVPALIKELREALQMLFPKAPIRTVGAGFRSGLCIRIEHPAALGADLVAAAVGAATLQKPPFLVLHCDAVTTLSVVDDSKEGPAFLGCAILPGPSLGADSLKNHAALLSDVLLTAPKTAIGTNSGDSVRAGLLLGHAYAIRGLIERFEAEIGKGELPVLAVGEECAALLPLLARAVRQDPFLIHRGLYQMALLNERKSKNPPKRGE